MNLFQGSSSEFVSAVAVYFAILDPFFTVAVFSAAAAHVPQSRRPREALVATLVAVAVIAAFALGGAQLLKLFSVSLNGIKMGGGVVLLVLGVQTVLQKAFAEVAQPGRSSPGVLIGSPVLAG
ncbi:MAG: MarC family protein, partial [Armatimonadota bacterium]